MNELRANLLRDVEGFLGKVFYWNSMPTLFWQIQGIIHLESECPKVLAINVRQPSQQAHIPVGLFLDSIRYKLLKVHEYDTVSKVFTSVASSPIYDCVVHQSQRR